MVPRAARSRRDNCLMEAVRQSTLPPHQRLTQLYSDTKQSYRAVSPPRLGDDTSDFARLQAKSQIQKDRLTAWGLGWSDDASAAKLSIDESVERAGLTDVVSSVLESIQSLLTQVEKMRPQRANYSTTSPIEKRAPPDLNQSWAEADTTKYEEIVTDLTSAIDVLYDLTKWRRTAIADSQDSEETASANVQFGETKSPQISRKAVPVRGQSVSDNTPAPHLKSRIDISTLVLPDEPPPPYHSLNTIISPRVLGYAQRRNPMASHSGKDDGMVNVPVLVEYANYDPSYRTNGMLPSLSRLDEILHAFHSPGHLASSDALLPLAGYFEDPNHSRFGLVYELPASAYLSTIGHSVDAVKPNSLLSILQASQKADHVTGSIPPLEQRLRLALELAQVFSLLQENEVSHRDVSSSNVIFFSSPPSDLSSSNSNKLPAHDFRKPYLCSFDLFSERLTSGEAPLNLYRHSDDPRADGSADIEKSAFRFDLYGLGLILLEIGIWAPLSEFYKSKYTMDEFRQRIRTLWMRRLADRCGSAYVRIVQGCLEAGNEKSSGSPREICNSIVPRLRRLCLSHDEYLPDDGFDHYLPRLPKLSESDQLWQPQPYVDEKSSPEFLPQLSESPVSSAQLDSKSHHQIILKSDELAEKRRQQTASKPKGNRGKRQEFPGKELPQNILKQWDEIGSSLANIVNHALRHSGESSSIGLTCTGYSEETAKPTFLITCASTCRVRQALRRKFHFDKDVFDLVIVKGGIVRSKAGATRRGAQRPRRSGANSTSTCSAEPLNPYHQLRPLCGASIGAFKDNEHLPPVSYGGVVMIDGQPYGMSVHHLIEDPDDDEDDVESLNVPIRSSASLAMNTWGTLDSSSAAFSDDPSYFTGMDFGSNLTGAYPSMLEIEEDEYDSDEEMESMTDDLSDDDELDEDNDFSGDREGIAEGDGEEIVITQPALEDVSDDFFPSEEDRDDDHLDSHTLGYIHASSGIRRWNRDGVQHEIDWALIKLKKDRLQPQNLVPGGKRFCPTAVKGTKPALAEPVCRGSYQPGEDLYPLSIANSAKMSDLYVHCFGRTSGLQGGKISKTMDFVKFPGRKSFSKSWYVVGNFGIGGDSGAWVIDNNGGSICGHVLAWSAALSRAYISPMDVMFEDIRRTLGAIDVSLPGGERSTGKVTLSRSVTSGPSSEPTASQGAIETSFSKLTVNAHQSTPQYARNGKQAASVSIRETPPSLVAQHFLLSGSPGHLEREWTSRRRALGQKIPG